MTRSDATYEALTKVPAVTLGFWIIKILATTLGETGGDTVTMTWLGETTAASGAERLPHRHGDLRRAAGRAGRGRRSGRANSIPGSIGRRSSPRRPAARRSPTSPTARSASAIRAARCCCSPACSRRCSPGTGRSGTVDVNTVIGPREETFYWITITFSQTLGTALGDWIADGGLGYSGGALVFGAGLAVLAILYFTTRVSRVFLFWAAFILTRPLGATVGDFLDKPLAKGGLELSRPIASAVLAVVIVALILLLPQRAGRHPGSGGSARVRPTELASRVRVGERRRHPAMAGPPYITDDPVPTDTGHWEIYAFTAGEGHGIRRRRATRGSTSTTAP